MDNCRSPLASSAGPFPRILRHQSRGFSHHQKIHEAQCKDVFIDEVSMLHHTVVDYFDDICLLVSKWKVVSGNIWWVKACLHRETVGVIIPCAISKADSDPRGSWMLALIALSNCQTCITLLGNPTILSHSQSPSSNSRGSHRRGYANDLGIYRGKDYHRTYSEIYFTATSHRV